MHAAPDFAGGSRRLTAWQPMADFDVNGEAARTPDFGSVPGSAVEPALQRRDLFALPLFSQRVADAPRLNVALRALAQQWERERPGVRVTNRGAYHSRQSLLESNEAAIVELRRAIVSAYAAVRREVYRLETPPDWQPAGIEGWVNVSRAGNHYVAHTHLGQGWHWSGTYYVSRGGASGGEGRIVFEDKTWDYNLGPRPIARLPHAGGAGTSEVGVDPQEGTLILFPSSLMHRVDAFSGPGERISIAFNIRDAALDWTFPSAAAAPVRPVHWLRHYLLGLYLPLRAVKSRVGALVVKRRRTR